MQRHTLVLIGSDTLQWRMLRYALTAITSVDVIADVVDVHRGIAYATTHQPTAILIELPKGAAARSYQDAISALAAQCPHSRLLVVAATLPPWQLLELIALGVRGYLLWRDLDVASVRHVVGAVLTGDVLVATSSLRDEVLAAAAAEQLPPQAAVRLTEREQAVLQGLAAGYTQHQIAATTQVSLRTVKRLVAGLQTKLGAPSPFVLGAKARALGLIVALA